MFGKIDIISHFNRKDEQLILDQIKLKVNYFTFQGGEKLEFKIIKLISLILNLIRNSAMDSQKRG